MTGSQKSADDRAIARFTVKRFCGETEERITDQVAVEEPLAIHLTFWSKERRATESIAVTMRTPGNDLELAAGYLFSEGVISRGVDIADIHPIGPEPANEIAVTLCPDVDFDAWRSLRKSLVASSCGICGKQFMSAIPSVPSSAQSASSVRHDLILRLPLLLREHQMHFEATGGLHAAALISASGLVRASYEDVGRHNALDKLLGHCLLANALPGGDELVFMSSRASYELIQKTATAGATILATVGGPSSLAVQAARDAGLTLICFVRDQRFNIYAGDWRVKS